MALTIGTTGAMRVLLEGPPPRIPGGLWAYRLGSDRTLLGGSFSEGGNVLLWARDVLRLPSAKETEHGLEALPPDGHGLTVLPFIAGERSTGWSTRATGVFEGLRVSTTPLEMLQALMESVAYRFGLVARLLQQQTGQTSTVIASGGGIRQSPYWLQLIADVLQAPVSVVEASEETSRGSAILALNALGEWPELDTCAPEIAVTYKPQAALADVYREAAARQQDLYERVLAQTRTSR